MDVELMEAEARATAAKHVANMLQKVEQLDNVENIKRRESRKKASVEAMLKTTMQSQLDGVKTCIGHIQMSLQEIMEIKTSLQEKDDSFKILPRLMENLYGLKEEGIRHSQYVAAMENVKHIFNVPGSVQKVQSFINDGKLLHAHQRLSDLENSRDDLLFEMHKLPQQSATDRNMLKHYFADVDKLSEALGNQLWLVLSRTLDSVRKEPQVIVTALRIIEREERADEIARDRQKTTGFIAPGRPKCWKRRAFQVLENKVQERIEGNQLEEREENKMWLVRHLEVIRMFVVDDLKVIKRYCGPCFPKHYFIEKSYENIYHNCISRHLQNVIKNGLEGNEYMTLLAWLSTYKSKDMMGNPDLNIDLEALGPLLDNREIDEQVHQYMEHVRKNFQEWMQNTLATEVKDWYRDTEPEADSNDYFHTSLPVILIQMIDQHLQLARTVHQSVVNRMMLQSLNLVINFCSSYKDAVRGYKEQHFLDRSRLKYFTHYMIAITNNCQQFKDLFEQLYKRFWHPCSQDDDAESALLELQNMYEQLRNEAIVYLQDELFLDLDRELVDLMTKKWQVSGSTLVDTVCATLEDYFEDYKHLNPTNLQTMMAGIERRVACSYIKSLLTRKSQLRNYEERKEVAEKFSKEGEQLKTLFNSTTTKPAKWESAFDAFPRIAVVLKLFDTNMLSLEISSLIHRYPDVTIEQLTELVLLRGDLGRSEARQLVTEMLEAATSSNKNITRSIFSEIHLPSNSFLPQKLT